MLIDFRERRREEGGGKERERERERNIDRLLLVCATNQRSNPKPRYVS